MKIAAALICLVVALGCRKAPESYDSSVGVAVKSSDHACLSIQNASLSAGKAVSLITAPQSPTVSQAEVVSASSEPCGRLADKTESHYVIRIVHGDVEDNLPVIAVIDGSTVLNKESGDSFRSCTSSEGVHLTIWHGKPLEGERLWHRYYYLGQDIEPNCTAKDTAEK